MKPLINLLTDLGAAGVDVFWVPVTVWTIVVLVAVGALKLLENKMTAVYHYHSRVALLWGLAAGVLGSALLHFLPGGSTGAAAMAKFIVIQNPISVATSAPAASAVIWSDPMLWAGLITALAILVATFALLKLLIDFSFLHSFSHRLSRSMADSRPNLSPANRHLLLANRHKIMVHFSDEVAVPCTFGWFCKKIVLPRYLAREPEKLNMALRHELTHIFNRDFLLNGTVQAIKALFCFHPLVHKLASDIEEYRELHCDRQVLQDADISQKHYAGLIFELSPNPVFKPTAAVNMAIHPSTLKKRIQTMKKSTQSLPSLKWSMSLMLAISLVITGLLACSDIEEGGITNSEVEDVQANMDKAPESEKPLYIVNGKEMNSTEDQVIISRLKPKYIKSLEVLKGGKATVQYGQKGSNGVIKIKLIDQEKAFSDLLDKALTQQLRNRSNQSDKPIFVAVEDMPELKGGLQGLMSKVKYPEQCKQAGIEGRMVLSFIVNKEGNTENIEIIRGIGGGCDEAAIEAVKNHAKFKPGKQRGKPVNVQYSLPIIFKLSG